MGQTRTPRVTPPTADEHAAGPLTGPISRRTFVAGAAAAGAVAWLSGPLGATAAGKRTFTILHTNDLHSNLIGLSPAADYTPFALNDDKTRGGFARLATLIAQRKAARQAQGPVLYPRRR